MPEKSSLNTDNAGKKAPARDVSDAPKSPRQRHVELAQRVYSVAINAGLTVGDRLPEQLLAEQCDVSRTPIRRALQLLEKQGIASADPDGGYRLAKISDSGTGHPIGMPQTEEEELFNAILDDLAARRIPTSQTLVAIQRRYNASRLTVQNTLQRLLEEQFVERAAGQRWLFKPMVVGSEATAQSFDFRIVLEPAALLSGGFRADPIGLASIRQTLEGLERCAEQDFDVQLAERSGSDFHILIARACTNPFFQDALLSHHQRRRNFSSGHSSNIFKMRQSIQELLKIIEQIERNQLELAADLLRAHLRMQSFGRPRVSGRSILPIPHSELSQQP